MSEIAPNASPGWYTDPTGLLRWWDGRQWGPYAPQASVSAQQLHAPYVAGQKEIGIAYLMLLLLGGFGAHYFYLNQPLSAVLFLILWWGGWAATFIGIGFLLLVAAGIWLIIDLFLLPSYVRAANQRRA